jgi:hypothetical protein
VVPKRLFGQPRARLALAELEALVGWLERSRVREHLGLIRDDHHYRWPARQQRPRSGPARCEREKTH